MFESTNTVDRVRGLPLAIIALRQIATLDFPEHPGHVGRGIAAARRFPHGGELLPAVRCRLVPPSIAQRLTHPLRDRHAVALGDNPDLLKFLVIEEDLQSSSHLMSMMYSSI